MIDYMYLFLYKFFAFLVNILPSSIINIVLSGLSRFSYRFSKKHHQIINANLDLAFDNALPQKEKDKIGIRTFYNLLQTTIGLMRRETYSKEDILRDVIFENEVIVHEALEKEKKIIFITAHYGNWELIPPLLTTHFHLDLSIIGRKLDSKMMDTVLVSNRERFNVKMIYRKNAIKNAVKAIRNGNALGLLLDQHLGEKQGGIAINFFRHKAYQSPAASILARTLDATIIPVFISTADHIKYSLTFYPALPVLKTENKEQDIQQMTQAQADIMEKIIRNKPDEWFWVHKRWKGFYPEIYQRDKI